MKICVKNDVYIFLWPLDLQFAPWVTLVQVVQCYVSTEFEVSTVLLFQEDRRHGQVDSQTDGVQHLMQSPRESHIIIIHKFLYQQNYVRCIVITDGVAGSVSWFGHHSVNVLMSFNLAKATVVNFIGTHSKPVFMWLSFVEHRVPWTLKHFATMLFLNVRNLKRNWLQGFTFCHFFHRYFPLLCSRYNYVYQLWL